MLKPCRLLYDPYSEPQPPSGGFVLKPLSMTLWAIPQAQPPSGGCVLKLENTHII